MGAVTCYVALTDGSTAYIWRLGAGGSHLVSGAGFNVAHTMAAGDVVEIQVSGAGPVTIKLLINGVLQCSTSDTSGYITAAGSAGFVPGQSDNTSVPAQVATMWAGAIGGPTETISPTTPTVALLGTQLFTAATALPGDTITWTATHGSFSPSTGTTSTYTAPSSGSTDPVSWVSSNLPTQTAGTTVALLGPPSVGLVTFTSATTSTVTMTCASNSGSSGQWYRATTSNFTPGGGNLLSGATSLTLSDTTAAAATDYWYVFVGTNGAGSTSSNQAYGRLQDQTLNFSAIGESTYTGYNINNDSANDLPDSIPSQIGYLVAEWGGYNSVTVDNQAADGQSTTYFYTSGAAQSPLTTAVAAAVANGSGYVHVMIGVNDTGVNSAATYRAAPGHLPDL